MVLADHHHGRVGDRVLAEEEAVIELSPEPRRARTRTPRMVPAWTLLVVFILGVAAHAVFIGLLERVHG